jgi:D-inositol-3-phosphate glycosyltransferase
VTVPRPNDIMQVGLLTGGSDKPYALGLTEALVAQGLLVDFIGSDELDVPDITQRPEVTFYNLRGDQSENVPLGRKVIRILSYYAKLVHYAAMARPPVLHILWNSKFELFDRTVLMLFYRLVGKRVVLTAHNVNAAKRDSRDGWLNRWSLRVQYRLCDHIFVHTERMKRELVDEFRVAEDRTSVIPFGMNNTIPTTGLTTAEARRQLGIPSDDRTVLFFGQIAPYKGLKDLVSALGALAKSGKAVRLLIAGKVKKGWNEYWDEIQALIAEGGIRDWVTERIGFIPDDEVEPYFKAADAVVLPYKEIFQSGVPFLAYSFGLPVIATDVGSLSDVIVDGRTGMLCAPGDTAALARAIEDYFSSDLYTHLASRRDDIRAIVAERHSWTKVGEITKAVYRSLSVHNPTSQGVDVRSG